MNLYKQIENFKPYNEQEQRDKEYLLHCLKNEPNVFDRKNIICHFTASAWIVNKSRDKALMIYHNIFDSWSWLGGHADGEQDLLAVAIREAQEESGIHNVCAINEDIFSLEVLTVDGHVKKGSYVSSHLHLNVTYLLEADENEELKIKKDENSGVKWFNLDEAIEASNEKWFKENIYKKLNEKLKNIISIKCEQIKI